MSGAADARLRREHRLRSSRDFERVERSGRRRAGQTFVIQLAPARSPDGIGLGLVVGRRVGGAVARNRVKRQLREWFRVRRAQLPPGSDLVVIARRGAAEREASAIRAELDRLVGA